MKKWCHVVLILILINKLLILVICVAIIRFVVGNFVTYEKVLIMMLHIEEIFPTFKMLVRFLEQSGRTPVKKLIF